MKFKIDENLPIETAERFRQDGYDAHTVYDESMGGSADQQIMDVCLKEGRALVTGDLDFADIRSYPPQNYHGIIVLRLTLQDKSSILKVVDWIVPYLQNEKLTGRLWIVQEDRIRFWNE